MVALLAAAAIAAVGAATLYRLDHALGYGLVPAGVESGEFVFGSMAIAALMTARVSVHLPGAGSAVEHGRLPVALQAFPGKI